MDDVHFPLAVKRWPGSGIPQWTVSGAAPKSTDTHPTAARSKDTQPQAPSEQAP